MQLDDLYSSFDGLKQYLAQLGIQQEIKDKDLCITAFVHKSFSADYNNILPHNERLEFLGDAILGAMIAKKLYLDYPKLAESKLTLYKIALVREEILAQVAREIKLGEILFVSKGEENNGGRDKDSILSDALEALIGYISLDMGITAAEDFIIRYIYFHIKSIPLFSTKSNKTKLQELIQKRHKIIPEYKEEIHSEKDHTPIYKSEIYVLGEKLAEGYGPSKKKAQDQAAGILYRQLSKKE